MIVDAELEVLSKSVSRIEVLKKGIVTLSLTLFLRDGDIVDIARRKFTEEVLKSSSMAVPLCTMERKWSEHSLQEKKCLT